MEEFFKTNKIELKHDKEFQNCLVFIYLFFIMNKRLKFVGILKTNII